jgi:predicted peptidase
MARIEGTQIMRPTFAGILLGLGLLPACAVPHVQPGQHAQLLHRRVVLTADLRYLLYLPGGYQARGSQRYPLLIFLHGSGEAGTDLERVKVHGPPKLVEHRPDFPFIVVSPQTPDADRGFDPVLLDALLDDLLERLPVDPDRVYLTGLSLGGEWTYGWAALRPERFAAIAPVSGDWAPAVACRLKNVPVWAFHGARDDVVPIDGDRAMIDAINECGGHAQLTVYPEAGHDAWTATYANPALYDWLLSQRRGGPPPDRPPPP